MKGKYQGAIGMPSHEGKMNASVIKKNLPSHKMKQNVWFFLVITCVSNAGY